MNDEPERKPALQISVHRSAFRIQRSPTGDR